MTFLVDSSVAIKWIADEGDSAVAQQWLLQSLSAPDLMLIELCNAAWKKVSKGELTPEQVLAGISELEPAIEFVSTRGLELRALEIGMELGHAIYDCVYLALAEILEAVVVTAEIRLINRCAQTEYAKLLRRFDDI